jgi:hypothetical protein
MDQFTHGVFRKNTSGCIVLKHNISRISKVAAVLRLKAGFYNLD